MSSSLQGKPGSPKRLASDEDAIVFPENARPTDESPTVISKTPPIVEPISSNKDKITELARRPASAESIVASLRGRRLAHYELIEHIGSGGMAAVIRAHDTQLDRFVALKILPPEMAAQTDNIQRFHQEAKAAAKLDHENIARVFFCGEDQGLFFIAFEFVEGINLRTMMERRGRIPVAEAVRYILQVATGLEHANTRGVVHRDVKPSNIIITPTGRAKLVDMGLARNLERRGEVDLTQSGMTLGTFDYISPEQALEPREADARSDIYSLGCTFYHLLTGQPPVPDGTPAKKLHHHQHKAPIDPRQVDPTIPDEIVMILGKMMAKSPKDRYQRPIHLVHHLMQVAQKVGVADDLPEGVLFVDAPLPSRPHSRPLLVIGMALAALVAVTLLLSLAPVTPPNAGKPVVFGKGNEPLDTKPNAVAVTPVKVNGSGPTWDPKEPVTNLAQLKSVLSSHDSISVKITADPIDLDGLVFKGVKGQRIEFEGDDADSTILRFQYPNSFGVAIGLTLDGADEVVFRKVKFEVNVAATPTQAAVAPIAVRGVKKVRFENCIWTQPNAPKIPPATVKRVPFASLLIDASDDADNVRPEVIVKECYFRGDTQNGGQVAVALNGPATVNMTNTAIGPHSAFFSFRDKCTLEHTAVSLKRSHGFVVTGPAFRFAQDAGARVSAEGNAFSRPDRRLADLGLAMPGLFYLAGDKPIVYEGRQNLYYALNHFVEKKNGVLITKPDDFQKYLATNKGSDERSEFIDLSSEQTSPLQNPNALTDAGHLAFQLSAGYADKFGLRNSWRGDMPLAEPVIAAKAPIPNPRIKIVDADEAGLKVGVFSNLASALSEAQNGDTILIKHGKSREVVVLPSTLKTGDTVTLKPFDENHHPILVLDKRPLDTDPAMFNVQSGVLNVQNLEILLDPAKAGYKAQSVVHLGESAQCSFKNCVFTLRRMTNTQLNVVTFTDLDMGTMMKTEPGSVTIPRAEFRECFVRGKGDLVSVRGCRPLQVDIEDSLIALAGQMLDTEAVPKAMPMDKAMMSWKMTRSTFVTTESAFALRSKTNQGLAKTEVKLEGCLLAGLTPEEPIATLELNNNREDKVSDYLVWEGNKQNFYANFDRMRNWMEQFQELNSVYDKVTFPRLTDELKQNLWHATPDLFRPADAELGRLKGYGLQLTPEVELRLLPTPEEVAPE